MNVKIKIALNGIAQKVARGSMTTEQAAAHFKKVTGQDLEEFAAQADPEVGKFLAYLEGAYPIPAAQLSEVDPLPDTVAIAQAQEAYEKAMEAANIQIATFPPVVNPEPEAPEAPEAPQDPEAEAPKVPQDPEAETPEAPQDPEAETPEAPQDPEAEAPEAPQDPEAGAAPTVTEERPKRTRKPAKAK